MNSDQRKLWYRWVGANALGELFGLGLTFFVTALAFSKFDDQQTLTSILLLFVFAVVSGAVEATLVGLAQWWAMRPWFPAIGRFAWWRGTLVGALIAYVMGYLPSTLMSISEVNAPSYTPAVEPPQWIILLLAAGLGLVGGAVLSFAQWLAMRGKARRAGLWIPANMLAWLFGMPLIFWGIDLSFKQPAVWLSMLVMVGTLLAAGAIVGAIHGAFLVSFTPSPQPAGPLAGSPERQAAMLE